MKVYIGDNSGIADFCRFSLRSDPNEIKRFCKNVGLKEIDLILILLGEKVEVENEIVDKILAEMKMRLFSPPKDNNIRFCSGKGLWV